MKEWQGLQVSLAGKLVLAGGLIGMLGMGAGAWVFGARPVEAQQQAPQVNWREWFFGFQEPVDVNDQGVVQTPGANRLVQVPAGWTVVSGGGVGPGHGIVLFCRR